MNKAANAVLPDFFGAPNTISGYFNRPVVVSLKRVQQELALGTNSLKGAPLSGSCSTAR